MGQCLACIRGQEEVAPSAPPEPYIPQSSQSGVPRISTPPPYSEIIPPVTRLPHPSHIHHPSHKVLRLMTWNLQVFTPQKASNLSVQEALCLMILENFISILVLQEVTSPSSLEMICRELNHPTLPLVRQSKERLGLTHQTWRVYTSLQSIGRLMGGHVEYGAVIVNENEFSGLQVVATRVLETGRRRGDDSAQKLFCRSPFLCHFKIANQLNLILTSVHLKSRGLGKVDEARTIDEVTSLGKFLEVAKECSLTNHPFIVCGDFNLQPSHEAFRPLESQHNLVNLLTDATNISTANPNGSTCYDNIWWNPNSNTSFCFSGYCGVIRDGFMVGSGFLSDHCPVWADFIISHI